MIKRTDHVAINVTDVEKCIPFWRDVLGLEQMHDFMMDGEFLDTVQAKTQMNYRIVKFKSPEGFMLELLEDKGHTVEPAKKLTLQDAGLRHFAFEVEDVDTAYEHVKKAGCETVSGPSTSEDGSMRLFFVRDPEHNLIELMQFYK
jgi:catechol 2,3-dioxygenase-like lactoylglutathione lyase family enzyme